MQSPADQESFANLLRSFRLKRGMSQRELATAAGVNNKTIIDYEQQRTVPRTEAILNDIVEALRLSDSQHRQLQEARAAFLSVHHFRGNERETSDDAASAPIHTVPSDTPALSSANSSLQTWKYVAGSAVAAVAISADGEMTVAGTLGKTVCCLDGNGHLRWQMPVGNQAWRVALSLDGQVVVAGTGSTRPWDLAGRGLYCFAADGSQRWRVDFDASVWGLALAADGNTIAVGTGGKQLLLFDGQGHQLWQHNVPGIGWYAWVWSTALSADGSLIAAGAADQRVRLFTRTGTLLGEHRTQGDVFTVAIAQDGTAIAAGDTNRHIYMWDREGHLLWEELLSDKVWAVVLNADGTRLLVGAGEKERHLRMYDQAGQLIWRRYVGGSVSSVVLSQDGQQTSAGTRDGGIFVFGADGTVVHQARAGKSVRDVALSAIGERMVAGSEDGIVYGYRLPRFVPVAVSPRIDEPIRFQRCTDLAEHIHQTLALIKQYEDLRRLSSDPREQQRAERALIDLRTQLAAFEREQHELGCPERGMQ